MYLEILRRRRKFNYKILSLDRIIGFFSYIESEAERLRLIARAKEMSIDEKVVREMII